MSARKVLLRESSEDPFNRFVQCNPHPQFSKLSSNDAAEGGSAELVLAPLNLSEVRCRAATGASASAALFFPPRARSQAFPSRAHAGFERARRPRDPSNLF